MIVVGGVVGGYDIDDAWVLTWTPPTGAPGPVEPLPGRVALALPWPNPFAHSTTVSFSLADRGPARLHVFDSAGRRVRVLADEPVAAGPREVVWDGIDDHGRRVSHGVYFVRLETRESTLARKVVLLK